MCTRKKVVQLQVPEDKSNYWKLPEKLREAFEKGVPKMLVKCNKCWECRQERARNWTYKIWLEALDYKEKCFLTLTYKSNKYGKNLNKAHLQNFIKRLRKKIAPKKIKYFGAGEYGEKKGRAHYHLIVLGWQPKDIKKSKKFISKKGNEMWVSKTVDELWGIGITTVQHFSKNEVAYLSLYIDHNSELDESINRKYNMLKKKILTKIKVNHGLLKPYKNRKGDTEYRKLKRVKDMTKEELYNYKKDYREAMNKIKPRKQPEFNLWSNGMGFNNYIDKKYYRYDLNIDSFKLERPKEFIRKIWENQDDFNEDIINHTVDEILKRKKHAEENYIDPKNLDDIRLEKAKEKGQWYNNENNKKLKRTVESIF